MGVHFISGKPGGGKTLYGVRLLLDELRHGTRPIVTNIALKMGALNEYLQKQGIDLGEEHITSRITIIGEEQLKTFYLYRGRGNVLEHVNGQDKELKVRYETAPPYGVLYVLDEVHIAFNARAWAETGKAVIYYLSQHRKLGDDVILITQAVMNVDKQMRSMTQDYTTIRNLKKEKAGIFKLPGIFLRRTFLEPPVGMAKSMESGSFTLDVSGIASCYDTAAGVGIHGRTGADTRDKGKGVPWFIYPIVVVALVLAVVKGLPPLVVWLVKPKPVTVTRVTNQAVAASGMAKPITPAVTVVTEEPGTPTVKEVAKNAVKMAGYYMNPTTGKLRVLLTDGRVYEAGDKHLSELWPDYCVIDRQTYPIVVKHEKGSDTPNN